jgi:uncharacterized Rmd1/YagE family protein
MDYRMQVLKESINTVEQYPITFVIIIVLLLLVLLKK